jgi:hypothetical protein
MIVWKTPLSEFLNAADEDNRAPPTLVDELLEYQKWDQGLIIPMTHPTFATARATGGIGGWGDQILLEQDEAGKWAAAGFFIDDDLVFGSRARKKGLSTELILRCFFYRKGWTKRIVYSDAGRAAMKKAHRVAVSRAAQAKLPIPENVLTDYPDLRSSQT